jgi:cold shock CspA family protein
MTGQITYWNNKRGFGFITNSDGSSIFFHTCNFEKGQQPVLGAIVSYKIAPPLSLGKKPQAVHVRFVEGQDALDLLAGTAPATDASMEGAK